jgi:hypothetical protein
MKDLDPEGYQHAQRRQRRDRHVVPAARLADKKYYEPKERGFEKEISAA